MASNVPSPTQGVSDEMLKRDLLRALDVMEAYFKRTEPPAPDPFDASTEPEGHAIDLIVKLRARTIARLSLTRQHRAGPPLRKPDCS